MKKTPIILLSLLICAGCTTMYNPATEQNETILIDSKTEEALGKNVIAELEKEYPESKDAKLQERVKAIGNKLSAVSDRKDITYNFTVLENKELNAMALPGGYVFIYKGLADILSDEELAYVLGHEVAHQAARHIVKKIQAGMAYQLIASIAFSSMGDAAGAQTIAQGTNIIYGLIDSGYSRQDEYQADKLGVKYAIKAGFDPYASFTALEKIKKEEGLDWKVLGYFRTHPFADERIEALKKEIPQLILKL